MFGNFRRLYISINEENILQQIKEMERDIIFRYASGKLSLAQQTIMHLDCWAPIVQVNRALLAGPALNTTTQSCTLQTL